MSDHAYIAEDIRGMAVPIDTLVSDPANVRIHPQENLDVIRASLRAYGQRKPIVVNKRTRIIEAGNGTLEAAKALGWTHLAVTLVDDDPITAAGFAIADNRSAELAIWDSEPLRQTLASIEFDEPDLAQMAADLEKSLPVVARDAPADAEGDGPDDQKDLARILAFGTTKIHLTQEEFDGLETALENHIEATGTVFGFVNSLLGD